MKKTGKLKESDFIDFIDKNIDRLAVALKLPEIKKVYKEKELIKGLFQTEKRIPPVYRGKVSIPRVDILIEHTNKKKATIIEVKVYKNITNLTMAVGQLLFYTEYLKQVSDVTKVQCVLVCDKIPADDILARVAKKNNLTLEFVEWGDDLRVLEAVNLGGRPELWDDPVELELNINRYFDNSEKPTLSGLAMSLGISRETLYKYGHKAKFSDIIKKSISKVESTYEEKLIYGNKPTGVIFALKNMGWSDKTDITSGGEKIKPILGGISDDNNNSNEETSEVQEED